MFTPAQDWPVYILIVLFFGVLAYFVISSRRTEKEDQNKKQRNKEGPK